MSVQINDNIWWVGKIDWELRKFHGEEYSTNKGTSFNAYLIKDEKNVLIDSVWKPFSEEFVKELENNIEIEKIDIVIINHSEPDHSGALPLLLSKIPDVPVYCTKNGMKALTGHYHKEWNFKVVNNGDKINIGKRDLTFIEAPMMHWPDTMMVWSDSDKILFSSDVFGQHFASEFMFDDLCDLCEIETEAIKYYANILTPFSSKALAKLSEIKELGIKPEIICPAHGIIWRQNADRIIENYSKWASDYKENQITIIYDTMYNSTRSMAEAIAEGITKSDSAVTVKLFNAAKSDKSDLMTEVFKSKGICVGSPTLNNGALTSVAGLLDEITGLNFKGKKALTFGSYGWSPAAIKLMSTRLEEGGFELFGTGIKALWNPDADVLLECRNYGSDFTKSF
jgi:anaerobic nitric oxide reductase flavorubredoxin